MKPERRFVTLVNDKLPGHIAHQSMAFTVTNGTPDQYYDFDYEAPNAPRLESANDLWVEYKWLPSPPVRRFTPKLSTLQEVWLRRRHRAGRNAWVIVGFPTVKGSLRSKSGYILTTPGEWEHEVDPRALQARLVVDIAKEIEAFVCRPS